jgi:uncharacterized protein YciI
MTGTPAHSIEEVWLVEATYAPDAAETRPPVRPVHLARIARLRAAGVVIEAGGCLDLSKSVFLVRAASEHEALELFREDVYTQHGVWVELRAAPFGRIRLDDEAAPGS